MPLCSIRAVSVVSCTLGSDRKYSGKVLKLSVTLGCSMNFSISFVLSIVERTSASFPVVDLSIAVVVFSYQ